MAAPVIVSRVRATLHRQGYQGFTQEQILETANSLKIDIDNPTPEDTKAVAQALKDSSMQSKPEIIPFSETDTNEELINQEYTTPIATPMLSTPSPTSLTVAQKQTLTQIQAQQLGIELSQLEITEVSSMVATEIVDSVGYLQAVGEIIKQFIERRNNQASALISEQITNIATIINTGNEQLGDIFNGANRQLSEIVSQCKQRREDYKSPYASRLESIREILQISQ